MRRLASSMMRTRPSPGESPSGKPGVEGLDGHLGRDLAGLRAAHAVGDDEQRRAHEVVVLVALPLQAEVGAVPVVSDSQHAQRSKENSLSPIRIRSPACRGCGPRSGSPFRYVPFVEPRSSNTITSPCGTRRACRADANPSSRRMSA